MRAVLERAGVKPGARDVMPVGLDGEQDFRNLSARPMPLDRALADDTLLVYGMNGRELPADHGGPVRTLVSGWIGPASIKWTGRIEVSSKVLVSIFNTEYGVRRWADVAGGAPARAQCREGVGALGPRLDGHSRQLRLPRAGDRRPRRNPT